MAKSQATVEAMMPTAKELRRIQVYIKFKCNQLHNKDVKFNLATHTKCQCPPDRRERACPIWLDEELAEIKAKKESKP